jgi:hypothetical protein
MRRYPSPSALRRSDPDSRAYLLADMHLRNLQHELTDAAPRVHQVLAGNDSWSIQDFLDQVIEAGHAMDWTLHFELGFFLGLEDSAAWAEVVANGIRKWMRDASAVDSWIAVRLPTDPTRVLIGQRTQSLDQGPRLLRARLDDLREATAPSRGPGIPYQVGRHFDVPMRHEWSVYTPWLQQ